MNFKKIMATVTSLVIAGSIIAGCEQKAPETTTAKATTTAETKVETTQATTSSAPGKDDGAVAVSNAENAVSMAASKTEGAVSKAENKVSSSVSNASSKVEGAKSNAEGAVSSAVSKADDKVSSAVSNASSKVENVTSNAGAKIEDAKSNANVAVSNAKSNANIAVSNAKSNAESAISNAKSNTEGAVSKAVSNTESAVVANTNVKMGLSTDEGGRGDKSFNDAAIAGLDRIEKEYGIKPIIIESKDASLYTQNLESIAGTSDLTIGVGFKMTEDIKNVAAMFPDKKFLLVDGVADGANVKNVLFKEQEGAFLLGVIAGKMTKTGKVGFIGGVEGDVIGRFEAGFVAGVYSVNKEAGKLLADRTMVSYAGNFSDVAKGTELAKDLYNKGADIIFHAAGGVGIGLFNAAKETGKFAMGVDSDQAAMIPDKADVILVSMIKKVDVAVYDSAKSLIEGKFEAGTTTLGLKEDAVGLSPTLHPSLKDNAEVMKLVEEFKGKIINGEIKVPGTLAELKDFVK